MPNPQLNTNFNNSDYNNNNQNPNINQNYDFNQNRNQNLVQNQNPFPQNFAQGHYPQTQQFQPNQQIPQNSYPIHEIYSKPKKKNNFLVFVVVVVVIFIIVALGGVGTYLFIDYSNKKEFSKEVSVVLVEGYDSYTGLIDKTSEKLNELKKNSLKLSSSQSAEDLENLELLMTNEIVSLEELIVDHNKDILDIRVGPNSDTENYKQDLVKDLENSKNKITAITKGYKSLNCFNQKNIKFIEMTDQVYQIYLEMQKSISSPDNKEAINAVGKMSDALEGYLIVIDEMRDCFGDTGGIYNEEAAIKDTNKAYDVYSTLLDGYKDLKIALEEKNATKYTSAEKKISSVKTSDLTFEENHYNIFDDKMIQKFGEYDTFAKESKETLNSKKQNIISNYSVRDNFFSL